MALSSATLSPAGAALANFDGASLLAQRDAETEELRKKRMLEAQGRGISPAGSSLIDYGVMSVPGAA